MYGGIKYDNSINESNKQVTNELWEFDLIRNRWTLLNSDLTGNEPNENVKNYILPVAVGGHSMCLIKNKDFTNSLLIFFGFSEYYGSTLNIIQEYNLGKYSL
jgi:hypothetical protein